MIEKMPPYASNFSEGFVPGKNTVLYSGPYWDNKEIEAGIEAFTKGSWLVAGEYVARFQNEFSRRFNVKHSQMVNSGSSANLVLITAMKEYMQWSDGDEIIVSPVGFPTTIAPIVQNNLKPVFVDIELDTLNFDVNAPDPAILSSLEEKITDRTRAIFVSPVLGNPPDMEKLVSVCQHRGIVLLGDNCDSLGTKWDGRLLNELYFAWTTSFYPAHHITTGEGGMVCSNDEELMKITRSLVWWGRDCRCVGKANLLPCGTCGNRFDKWIDGYDGVVDHKYVFTQIGFNAVPLDMQGAIGLVQLKKFDEIESKRRANKEKISRIFENSSRVRVANSLSKADASWFGVPLICKNRAVKESLVAYFEVNKIQTRPYFAGNILMHPGYKHLGDYRQFPKANMVLDRVFFLGCPPQYDDTIISYIGEVFSRWSFIRTFGLGKTEPHTM